MALNPQLIARQALKARGVSNIQIVNMTAKTRLDLGLIDNKTYNRLTQDMTSGSIHFRRAKTRSEAIRRRVPFGGFSS